MPYKVTVYGASDIGLVRSNNEDSWKNLPDRQFFVIADGMGGHQAGEIASQKTVQSLCHLFEKNLDSFYQDVSSAKVMLSKIIYEVNAFVYNLGRNSPELRGMGTTLCCCFLHPQGLIYAHVGDSRIYRFRNHHLEQLTKDHSLIRELIDLGELTEDQAKKFSCKNVITKAIGTQASVEACVNYIPILEGDLFLLCTDGLTDLLSQAEIEKLIEETSEAKIGERLISRAKERGGYDNITVVMVKIHGPYLSRL